MPQTAFRTSVVRGLRASKAPAGPVGLPGVVRGAAPPEASAAEAPRLTRVVRAGRARMAARPLPVADLAGELVGALPEPEAPGLHAPSDELDFEAGLDAPVAEPPPPPVDIEALREEIAAEWRARMEEEVERARDDGYRQGHADTLRTHQKKFEADRAALSADLAAAASARARLMETSERLAATLAFDVAEAILGAGVGEAARKASIGSLHDALEAVGADADLVLTVHPVDLLRLSETGADDEIRAAHERLRIQPDPAVEEGDWQLATPDTVVRHVRTEMLATLRRRLGLLSMAG